MDIKNSIEIVTEFISRSSFTKIYSDRNLPFSVSSEFSMLEPENAVDYLLSSSQVGGRVIGFFKDLPRVVVKNALRGDCFFVVLGLPNQIDIPTLFCRKLEDFTMMTSIAFKLSAVVKLPIVIAISDNVMSNYATAKKYDYDMHRSQNYISKEFGTTFLTPKDFNDSYNVAKQVLKEVFPDEETRFNELSFNNPSKPFFSYIIPDNLHFSVEKNITVYESEQEPISKLVSSICKGRFEYSTVEDEKFISHHEYLCAGCPIVTIVSGYANKEGYRLFTDLKCEGIKSKFSLTHMSFEQYLGILSPNLNIKPVMITNLSSYNPCQSHLLRFGTVVLLNNSNIKYVDGFTSIKNPKKFILDRNIFFPYSCYNIKNYGWARIDKRSCDCYELSLDTPPCIEKTACVSLSIVDGKAKADGSTCVGCMSCAKFCPKKAIK